MLRPLEIDRQRPAMTIFQSIYFRRCGIGGRLRSGAFAGSETERNAACLLFTVDRRLGRMMHCASTLSAASLMAATAGAMLSASAASVSPVSLRANAPRKRMTAPADAASLFSLTLAAAASFSAPAAEAVSADSARAASADTASAAAAELVSFVSVIAAVAVDRHDKRNRTGQRIGGFRLCMRTRYRQQCRCACRIASSRPSR